MSYSDPLFALAKEWKECKAMMACWKHSMEEELYFTKSQGVLYSTVTIHNGMTHLCQAIDNLFSYSLFTLGNLYKTGIKKHHIAKEPYKY